MKTFLAALLAAGSVMAQDAIPADLAAQMDKARTMLGSDSDRAVLDKQMQAVQKQLASVDKQNAAMDKARDVMDKVRTLSQDSLRFETNINIDKMMAFQMPAIRIGNSYSSDGAYDSGTRLLDQRKYDEAVQQFDRVIGNKSSRADGALYWKAYALHRSGHRDDALAAIANLRQNYASSGWLRDAQALEAEVKSGSGQAATASQEADEDMKLLAISALMNADPERAVPLLEGVLKSSASRKVKDKALFVLTQNRAPRSQQILMDYAKGAGNPDLQSSAIHYVGMSGTKEAGQQLATIYSSSADARIKKDILRELGNNRGNGETLQTLIRGEKDGALRAEGIRYLANTRDTPSATLATFYTADADASSKRTIIEALGSRNDAKTIIELVRKESDPDLKKSAVSRLGSMKGNSDALDYLSELLK